MVAFELTLIFVFNCVFVANAAGGTAWSLLLYFHLFFVFECYNCVCLFVDVVVVVVVVIVVVVVDDVYMRLVGGSDKVYANATRALEPRERSIGF